MLGADEAQALLGAIDTDSLPGLRGCHTFRATVITALNQTDVTYSPRFRVCSDEQA